MILGKIYFYWKSVLVYARSQVEVTVCPDSLWVTLSMSLPPTNLAEALAQPETAFISKPEASPVTTALILWPWVSNSASWPMVQEFSVF